MSTSTSTSTSASMSMSMSMLDEQDRVCADRWLTDGTGFLTLSR